MIKNIVFDMGQVLVDFDIRAFADRYDISEEDKELLLDVVFIGNANWSLNDWGYITEQDVAERAKPLLPGRLHKIAEELATRWWDPIIPVEGMEDVVRRLKENGYGIYLLSNAGYTHRDYWGSVPGSQYFDGIVVSAYERLVKPQPEIYTRLLARFGLKGEECLFVDDRELNLAGAEIAGMHSMIFKGREDFLMRLEKAGIKI